MPIHPTLKALYPKRWRELSHEIRFGRAKGRCEDCKRPHGMVVRALPDGRWLDPATGIWRGKDGRKAPDPDLVDWTKMRETKVVLAAAHLDHDPTNNRRRNLRSLCQRCHMLHDRDYHLEQRRVTYGLRMALGDLFHGVYRRGQRGS